MPDMAKLNNQERCIQCNACLPDCPSEGITVVNAVFILDPRLCAECAGMYLRSLCATGSGGTALADEGPTEREASNGRTRRHASRHPGHPSRD